MSRKGATRGKADGNSFRGYEGHTLRRDPYGTQSHPVVIRLNSFVSPDNRGVTVVPITEVDEFFDNGFSFCQNRYNADKGRPLNDREKWTRVEKCLRENCISVKNSYNRVAGRASQTFVVPAIGHWIVKDDVVEVYKRFWLFWKGKYHDPSIIHTIRNCRLSPLCPLRTARDPEPNLRDSIDGMELLARSEYSQIDLSGKRGRKGGSRLWQGRFFHEIDLGAVVHVRMLVVLGGYPRRLQMFPYLTSQVDCTDEETLAELKALTREHKHYGSRKVYVVRPEDLAWTTLFDVYYRDLISGKWHLYKENMAGNVDSVGERAHHVNILARSLRVVPKEWERSAEIRCRFYGSRQLYGHGERHASRTASEDAGTARSSLSTSAAGGMEVVQYELVQAEVGGMVQDGSQWNYRDDWGQVSKWDDKNTLRRSMQSELEEYWSHDAHCI